MANDRLPRLVARTALILLVGTGPVWADASYDVSLNTSALPAGDYSLFFQFTDGSGANDANNIVRLGDFDFGGGSAVTGPQLWGGASGDWAAGVTLIDSEFFNAIVQGFTPGSQLSYRLDLTTHADATGTPDLFAMSVLDANGHEIPTADWLGVNTLLTLTLDATLDVQTFPTDPTTATSTGDFIAMAAPVLTPVPEPSSLIEFGLGLAWLLGRRGLKLTRRSR